ncbi:MAG: tyrosine-type recombinase/integrase [Bacilli bacterium]|nr:tyrosine-type recombinase/integrase [Bacilli bacterium]
MSVKLIDKNKYMIEAFIGYNNKGKKIRQYKTFKGTERQAKNKENEMIQKYKNQVLNDIDYTKITFEELSKIYMEKHVKHLSPTTYIGYEKMLEVINEDFGKRKLANLNPLVLEDFYNKLRKKRVPKKLTENTILHYYVLIGAILNKAKRWKIISDNPNEAIDRPIKEKKESKYYNVEKTKKLLEVLENEPLKYQVLIRLAIDSGARVGEILGLEWEDINFDMGYININKVVYAIKGGIKEKDKPKNNSSIRPVTLMEKTLDLLKEFKKQQDFLKNQLGTKWLGCKKVFTSEEGSYMHTCTPRHILGNIIDKYDLPKINFHSLRHTSASLQIALGVPMKVISKRLGHSSSNTTDIIYSHVSIALQNEVTNKMEQLLNS